MEKLKEIKDQVAREEDFTDWASLWGFYLGREKYHLYDLASMEVARRYAKAVAEDALKRAAEQAKILVSKGETRLDVKSYTLDGGVRFSPDYDRILSTKINLDL